MTKLKIRAVVVLLAGLAIAGCDRRDEATAPVARAATRSVAAAQGTQFYLYEGQPVYLDRDSTRFIVQTTGSTPAIAAQEVLATLGLTVADAGPVSAATAHRVLRLSNVNSAMVDRATAALRADARFTFASPVYYTREGKHLVALLNRLMVQFDPQISAAQVDSINRALGTSTISPPVPDSGYLAWRLAYPRGADPLQIAQALSRSPLVQWADPDMVSDQHPDVVPTDPYYGLQFHLKNSITFGGVPVDINVEPAWNLTLGSHSIRVTVIDDGLDVFQGNSGGGYSGDFIGPFGGAAAHDYLSFPGEDPLHPCCNDTHGTSVAGIIAATQNNGVGGAGIAPNVIVNIARIFRKTYPPDSYTRNPLTDNASNAQIGAAINWAWQYAFSDVINNSWGGGSPSTDITSAINNALSSGRGGLGTVVVFSAGNTSARGSGIIGSVEYPATLSSSTNVISVGAIDRYGAPADYTPNGPIDLVAPSGHYTNPCVGEVVTMDRYGSPGCDDGPGGDQNYTSTFSGTSATAPQVSGVAALLLSIRPSLTVTRVKSILRSSANPWGASTTYGAGKLNAYQALIAP